MLACAALCTALIATATGEDAVASFDSLRENDWYGTTTDDERIDMAWDLLHVFRYAGYPVGGITANTFAQAMNDYYDQDKSLSVWEVALVVLESMVPGENSLRMPSDYAAEDATRYQALGASDWYGTTTDGERVDMAWALLSILRQSGQTIGHTCANDFAQAMNDYYDQDKSLSVWEVASIVLEDLR